MRRNIYLLETDDQRTTLMITHSLSAVRCAHRIVVLSQGTVVEQGTHDELMNVPNGFYASMVARQQRNPDDGNVDDNEKKPKDVSSISNGSESSHCESKMIEHDQDEQNPDHVSSDESRKRTGSYQRIKSDRGTVKS